MNKLKKITQFRLFLPLLCLVLVLLVNLVTTPDFLQSVYVTECFTDTLLTLSTVPASW